VTSTKDNVFEGLGETFGVSQLASESPFLPTMWSLKTVCGANRSINLCDSAAMGN